jgi:hypothetical protein
MLHNRAVLREIGIGSTIANKNFCDRMRNSPDKGFVFHDNLQHLEATFQFIEVIGIYLYLLTGGYRLCI